MSTKRRVIGFDFDDVLINFNEALCQYHNENHGTNYRRKDIHTFSLEETWGCVRETAIERITAFYKSEHHSSAEPTDGAIEGIQKLRVDNSLVIVTARPEAMKDLTYRWLDRYFPSVFGEVHFTNTFGEGQKRAKSEVCRELGVEIFVDDSLNNARDIASIPIPVLLLDSPWNQEEVVSPIVRVYSWKEIVEVLSL